ncbi:MAG: hypothetical protein HY717_13040 [Planctomycetes bacterium]|nr:hypothetical protein [Planctomycetota bacterium]
MKKSSIRRDLEALAGRSPVLEIVDYLDSGPEVRAVACFQVPTLVQPVNGQVWVAGPVLVGLRYHENFLSSPPIAWEVATLLGPPEAMHPNLSQAGGLCLGAPVAGFSMEILHLIFAAISLQSYNCIEWQSLDLEASAFVRSHAHFFPIVSTGLFEEPDLEPRYRRHKGDFSPFAFPLSPRSARRGTPVGGVPA